MAKKLKGMRAIIAGLPEHRRAAWASYPIVVEVQRPGLKEEREALAQKIAAAHVRRAAALMGE